MTEAFVLHGEANSGAVAVEAALSLIGLPYSVVETTTADPAGSPGTPMRQVPALRLPGGEVMTESAAILIWLADLHPAAGLSPLVDSPLRPAFLRWMAFVSSQIYAHYWAVDFPARLLTAPAAQAELKAALAARIVHGWERLEADFTPGMYCVGDTLTVLDLYVTVVSRWTPREPPHDRIAPRLGEIVRRVEADPRLADLWAERFPLGAA